VGGCEIGEGLVKGAGRRGPTRSGKGCSVRKKLTFLTIKEAQMVLGDWSLAIPWEKEYGLGVS